MHRAALAVAQPAILAEDLQHHALDVAALGDAVAMAAMGAGDVVALGAELLADADGAGFLAGIEMHEAGDLAVRELDMQPLLELADRTHPPIGLLELAAVQLKHALSPLSILGRRVRSRRGRCPARTNGAARR